MHLYLCMRVYMCMRTYSIYVNACVHVYVYVLCIAHCVLCMYMCTCIVEVKGEGERGAEMVGDRRENFAL